MSYEGRFHEGIFEKGGREKKKWVSSLQRGEDEQVQEKEMSQTQWWAGRDLREEGEGEILEQKTMMLGRPARRRWLEELSPIPIIKLGLVQNIIVVASLQESHLLIFTPL